MILFCIIFIDFHLNHLISQGSLSKMAIHDYSL